MPPPLVGVDRWLPWRRAAYRDKVASGLERHRAALAAHAAAEKSRNERLQEALALHQQAQDNAKRIAAEHNRQVDEFKRAYLEGLPDAINSYCLRVLKRSRYPSGFPNTARTAYIRESRQLVIEYDLPPFDVVPGVARFKCIKTQNAIVEVPRPLSERKRL